LGIGELIESNRNIISKLFKVMVWFSSCNPGIGKKKKKKRVGFINGEG
jgi:hypothetical protein